MDQDLERRIEERRQEAKNKKIWEKAYTIAQVLGWHKSEIDGELGEFHTYGFVCKPIEIKVEGLVTCFYNNKKVYAGNTCDAKCYIPGEWEEKFEALYIKAVKTGEEKIKEELERKEVQRTKEEIELRARFGLE